MSDHFAAIGFQVDDQETMMGYMQQMLEGSEVRFTPRGGTVHLHWADPSGAAHVFHMREHGGELELECATPFFDPPSSLTRWRVTADSVVKDESCIHCSGLDCSIIDHDGDCSTRSAVQLLCFKPYERWLRPGRLLDLEVVAFADTAAVHDSHEAYLEAEREAWADPDGEERLMPNGKPIRPADNLFMPVGMLADANVFMSQRARVKFAGRVLESHRPENGMTGQAFVHLRVDTYPGALDVVVAPGVVEGDPTPGAIASVEGWLVGRPVEEPPEPGPWWKRLFGR